MSEIVKPTKSRKGRKIGCSIAGAILLLLVWFAGPPLLDLGRGGFLSCAPPKHEYSATSEQNLKAIYQAMMLYHESEGQFPEANGWMDAIDNRISSNDLKKGEEKKKLIRPDLIGQEGNYGYAMNPVASAKYKDDVKDPSTTPLIFESKETVRNANGDPEKSRDGLAISVDGTILKQP